MDPASHFVLIRPLLFSLISHYFFGLSGVLSFAILIWRCTFSISFTFTHLDTTSRKSHYISLPAPPTIYIILHCTFCLSASFSDEHGLTYFFFCPYFFHTLYIVSGSCSCSCSSHFCQSLASLCHPLTLTVSLSIHLSFPFPRRRSELESLAHSFTFLYHFTIPFLGSASIDALDWLGFSGLVALFDCNISPTAIGLLYIHLSCIIFIPSTYLLISLSMYKDPGTEAVTDDLKGALTWS